MALQELVRAILGDGMGGVRGGVMLETAVLVHYSYTGNPEDYTLVPRAVKARAVGKPLQFPSIPRAQVDYELAAERVLHQSGFKPDAYISNESTTAEGELVTTVQFYEITGFDGYDVSDLFGFPVKRGLKDDEVVQVATQTR